MKTPQNLDRTIKKDRTAFTSSAQVYGRNNLKNITKKARFTNGPCTFMHIVAALFTAMFLMSCISGAQALTISNDHGGKIINYALKVATLRQSGKHVRFNGRCDSACTLYLGLPTNQLCVTPSASFGFHLPFGVSARNNRAAANYMMRQYPAWVRAWIAQNGGLSNRVITMNYGYAGKHMRQCT